MSQYTWNENDTKIVCLCYLINLSPKVASTLLPHIKLTSIRAKYSNCRYLHTGMGWGSNYSKLHEQIWKLINE
ncbi:MAG: hypothetical protein CMF96_02870 [Candidatus Marinimicrobia bacterium]|nr:hypothetical protein [Candidatus Neomarinimicrobiota bacterium]